MAHDESFIFAVFNAAATRTYRAAVSAGLTTADREDLHQAIVLDLLERAGRFDPARGSAGTFTGMVSEHQTADFLSALNRDRARLTSFSMQAAANDDDVTAAVGGHLEGAVPMWADDRDLFADTDTLHDLETALAYMNGEQVDLFQLLTAHQDLPSAARRPACRRQRSTAASLTCRCTCGCSASRRPPDRSRAWLRRTRRLAR